MKKGEKKWGTWNLRKPNEVTILQLQALARRDLLGHDNSVKNSYIEGYDIRLPHDELAHIKEGFNFFDRDGDGTLNVEDLGMALRALGLLANNQEVASLAMKLDPDRTGLLDLEDFLKCVVELKSKADTPEDIRSAFSVFDKDGTGLLKVDEFIHVLQAIGDPLSHDEVHQIVSDLDKYGDGMIRMYDLVELIRPKSTAENDESLRQDQVNTLLRGVSRTIMSDYSDRNF